MSTVNKTPSLGRTVFLRAILAVPVMALIIILPAGRWNYWQGWMYILTLVIPMFFIFAYLLKNDPALLERRMRMREKEAVQRKIVSLSYLYFLAAFILPGLDVRFGWSNVPPFVSIIADVFVFAGYMVFFWVLVTNSFVSRVVEVESNQKVISTGPYALVRHPMSRARARTTATANTARPRRIPNHSGVFVVNECMKGTWLIKVHIPQQASR